MEKIVLTDEIKFREEPEIKKEAAIIAKEIGLDLSTVIRLFLRKLVEKRALPFELPAPNESTIAAMKEADEDRSPLPAFETPEEMHAYMMGRKG